MKSIFLLHLFATLFMTGVIWMVQVVHYPLFAKVGLAEFTRYHLDHNTLITFIVMPPMLIEIGTAALFVANRPSFMSSNQAWLGLFLVLIIWLSTFFLQVPQHSVLGSGFQENAHSLLVKGNWIRTVAWTARSGLLLWLVWKVLP